MVKLQKTFLAKRVDEKACGWGKLYSHNRYKDFWKRARKDLVLG